MKAIPFFFIVALFFTGLFSCSDRQQLMVLDDVESLMESSPDSALAILKKIDKSDFNTKAERARYALLMSMALDKNYIDTTNFNVLQPAIDYYLKKGTATDKLRTYYYQGRIYDNKGQNDSALNCFVKAIDNIPGSTDSLCAARTHVSLARMYYEFRDIDSYIQHYLIATKIYNKKGQKKYEFDCLLNALKGTILLNLKFLSDSIINVCMSFDSISKTQYRELQKSLFSYKINYGNKIELKKSIKDYENLLCNDISSLLNIALAYQKIGDNTKTLQILQTINNSNVNYDTIRYLAISVSAYKNLGDYKNALLKYWDYSHRSDSIIARKFEQKSKSIEEKHKIELQAQKDINEKSKIIFACIGGIVLLTLGIVILLLFVRSHRIQKDLAIQKTHTAQLENENLAHRIQNLESESESLKMLLESSSEFPTEVQEALKERIEMLNLLLASYITANDQYGRPYDIWVKQLTENTDQFMNSNRLAFQASHPNFIRYFEEHGLTTDEINYVCLYALGLNGKEVGNYMKKRSHVNTSSTIRKKLGIDKHETNIGIFVRRLLKDL